MRRGRAEPHYAGDRRRRNIALRRTERTGPPLRICRCNGETVRNRVGGKADFSYWQCYEGPDGPIAQLDRVTDFYSVGCRFESCWDRQYFQWDAGSGPVESVYHAV